MRWLYYHPNSVEYQANKCATPISWKVCWTNNIAQQLELVEFSHLSRRGLAMAALFAIKELLSFEEKLIRAKNTSRCPALLRWQLNGSIIQIPHSLSCSTRQAACHHSFKGKFQSGVLNAKKLWWKWRRSGKQKPTFWNATQTVEAARQVSPRQGNFAEPAMATIVDSVRTKLNSCWVIIQAFLLL